MKVQYVYVFAISYISETLTIRYLLAEINYFN